MLGALLVLILAAGGVAAQTGVLQTAQPTPPVQQQIVTAPPVVVQQEQEGDVEVEADAEGTTIDIEVTGGGGGGDQGVEGGTVLEIGGEDQLCFFLEYTGGGPLSDEEFEDLLATTGGGIGTPPLNVIFHRLCYDPTGQVVRTNSPAIRVPGPQTILLNGAGGFFLEELEDSLPPVAQPLTFSPNAQQITGVETWIQEPPVTYLGPEEITLQGVTAAIQAHLRSVEIFPENDDSSFTCTFFDSDNNLASQFTEWTPGTTAETECGHTYWEVPTDSSTYQMKAVYHWVYSWKPPFSNDFIEYGVEPEVPITFDVEVVDLEAVIGRG